MKSYEKESLLKSFTLFFSIQFIFLSIVIYQHYHKVLHEYDMFIGNKMMQCHLNTECNDFKSLTVKDIADKEVHTFYKDEDVYMLFKDNALYKKMSIDKQRYIDKQTDIQKHIVLEFLLYLIVLILESFFLALYAIRPLKKALKLNEEFVKDILHDFNTPLSALKINFKILKKKFGNDDAINRSEEAIQSILSLQDNLHYYISQNKLHNEKVRLDKIIEQRVVYFQSIFPNLNISCDVQDTNVYIIKDIITRIIDNLMSNASKYNKDDGMVKVILKNKLLTIEDSGVGIKNPQEIFQRYYKETNKGIGIGLHIVQKLCEELNINIKVESRLNVGTKFTLDLTKLKDGKYGI